MKIKLLAFARAEDLFETRELEVELASNAKLADLKDWLLEQFPDANDLVKRSTFAVNQQYATDDTTLDEAMEVAIIPPVSGG